MSHNRDTYCQLTARIHVDEQREAHRARVLVVIYEECMYREETLERRLVGVGMHVPHEDETSIRATPAACEGASFTVPGSSASIAASASWS